MEKPSLYVLRGNDSNRLQELLKGFKAELGTPDMADLNTTLLDGDTLNLEALRADCLTIPFLTARRLVIIEKAKPMLSKLGKEEQVRFQELLEELPEATALVLLVEDQQIIRRGETSWENAKNYAWLLEWVASHPSRAYIAECALPLEDDMSAWVMKKAREDGGEFYPDAARLLAGYVGNNTLRARQEVTKLLTYVNNQRAVTAEDVSLLTEQDQEGNIFTLTDALGERNASKAMEQFRLLSETNEMAELSGMIHRQFRLLIQAREILDEGGGSRQVEQELRVLPFVSEKLIAQARRFSMGQLLDIFRHLLKIDEDLKTGGMPGDVAFELLIAELTAK